MASFNKHQVLNKCKILNLLIFLSFLENFVTLQTKDAMQLESIVSKRMRWGPGGTSPPHFPAYRRATKFRAILIFFREIFFCKLKVASAATDKLTASNCCCNGCNQQAVGYALHGEMMHGACIEELIFTVGCITF